MRLLRSVTAYKGIDLVAEWIWHRKCWSTLGTTPYRRTYLLVAS